MLGSKCPDDVPTPPVYGFDDIEDEWIFEMLGIVRVLRHKFSIQDCLMKIKAKNLFFGSERKKKNSERGRKLRGKKKKKSCRKKGERN
jgi:hypothetical protein